MRRTNTTENRPQEQMLAQIELNRVTTGTALRRGRYTALSGYGVFAFRVVHDADPSFFHIIPEHFGADLRRIMVSMLTFFSNLTPENVDENFRMDVVIIMRMFKTHITIYSTVNNGDSNEPLNFLSEIMSKWANYDMITDLMTVNQYSHDDQVAWVKARISENEGGL
jgi:hypothetical protein